MHFDAGTALQGASRLGVNKRALVQTEWSSCGVAPEFLLAPIQAKTLVQTGRMHDIPQAYCVNVGLVQAKCALV